MTRTLTAALFQQYVEQGWMKCTECGRIKIEDCENINEVCEVWNEHVRNKHK